ncbi:MAG: type IV secretion system DNA-binding domain-containing protein [Phycisphaerales bacterium]|nr:type IV secretion system DNA-binding domain-containing protein [Phycisphaerales bacterium]
MERELRPSAFVFRAEHVSPEVLQYLDSAQRSRIGFLLLIPFLILLGVFLGWLSLGYALPLAAALAAALAVWSYLTRGGPSAAMIILPLVVIGGLLFCRFAAVLLANQAIATTALAAAGFVSYWAFAQRPLDLATAWSQTVAVGERQMAAWSFGSARAGAWILGVALAIIAVVPTLHSTTLALILLVLFLLGVTLVYSSFTGQRPDRAIGSLARLAQHIDLLYFGYPDRARVHAGQWAPSESLAARRRAYTAQTVPLYLATVIGLSLCCPWEIFAAWATPGFRWTVPVEQQASGYNWLVRPLGYALQSHPSYLWGLLIALPLLLFLAPTLRFVSLLPALVQVDRLKRATVQQRPATAATPTPHPVPPTRDPADPFDLGDLDYPRTQWDEIVDRLRNSNVAHRVGEESLPENEHLYFGSYTVTGAPALIHRSIIDEHGYVAGQSGSGKTALGLIPLVTQLIRGKGPDDLTPVVVFDLKGDLALFNTVRIEAQRKRRELQKLRPWTGEGKDPRVALKPFHIRSGYATFGFNPLRNLQAHAHRPVELAEAIISALGLFYGDRYGAGFYSKRHTTLLIDVLREKDKAGQIRNYRDIAAVLDEMKREADRGKMRDTEELQDSLAIVAEFDQLAAMDPGHAIHMPDVVKCGQVVYFCLPAITSQLSVRAVAKLAIYSLLEASREFRESSTGDDATRRTYVVIDEFQELAARNLAVIFQQARSAGLSLVVANQDPSALKLPDMDLKQTVYTNTRFKQFFTVTDPREAQDLMLLSGEQTDYQRQWSTTHTVGSVGDRASESVSHGYNEREIIRTDLLPNEIRDITNASNDSLLWVLRDSGFTKLFGRFTRVTTPWTLDKDEYNRRNRTPWPRAPGPPSEPSADLSMTLGDGPGDADNRPKNVAVDLAAAIQADLQGQSRDGLPKVKAKRGRRGKGTRQTEEQQ